MCSKLTGYDFWNSVLKSPKYVAAPMVDMSELSFRMLCRHYKAQLCFSPMLHSQQFLQDSLYRSDTFSTCPEDNPLIVQFCSNDPLDFVNAAALVSSQCDAIDLNLGCPQAIARKGYYGAFLQDDWNLIHSIVQKAATELPIPVTCKMRILPGDFRNSVQYAKMLENSGCSVLTVHGRTREQKGHATGLASWEAIKLIKENINIPVIANGNILSFTDVKECLEYTGADAVMSAEALLHNPALFSGKNPPVWTVVQEYLQFAEKYNTPIRCVRCHLFKILYLCIHQDSDIQQILAEGKTFADFYSVCDLLKNLPKVHSNTLKKKENEDNIYSLAGMDFSLPEVTSLKEGETNSNTILQDQLKKESMLESTDNFVPSLFNPEKMNDNMHSTEQVTEDIDLNEKKSPIKHLPIWLCHSRPRVVDEESKTRGCYSKYFQSLPQKTHSLQEDAEEQYMSKKKLRRARHHERVLAAMKEKRKSQKMRRKQKLAEQRESQVIEKVESEDKVKITKKEKKMLIRERLFKAQGTSPKVCINLGFASEMDNKVEMTEKSPEELFKSEDLIYLSPDSETVLTSLDRNKVYVIGGIVDGTVKKDLSLNYAKQFDIKTARLPVSEYLVKCSQNPGTTVLTVNQVFDILLKYYETEDWVQALSNNVPLRKGYCAPVQVGELAVTTTPCENRQRLADQNS